MNKNNVAILVLLIVTIAGVSYAIGSATLGAQSLKPEQIKTATAISADITQPQASVFAPDAINPTVSITIGSPSTQNPLGN